MFSILLLYQYVFNESTQLTQLLTASHVRTSSCDLCKEDTLLLEALFGLHTAVGPAESDLAEMHCVA